ncbi:MAG TPA: DUF2203 domain-containing protein [Pyrinomonadaceae bacterium]|nr:DUF2203 domain-containing protein [Pyrinomonadaceae bacterium]
MKIFSVEEANSLLPSVRSLVKKIQRAHAQLMAEQDAAKLASECADQGGGGIANGPAYAANLINMTSLVGELETLGVQLKDFGRGLIDFPSLRDGRVVLLCWQLGEGDQLEWWHDVDAGFAGRTPL